MSAFSRILGATLALFALPAFAADIEFSHKLHLGKVGLTCAACHSSVEASAEAADSNIPSAAVCRACHTGQTAPEIDLSALEAHEPSRRDFRFNHQFHLGMGDVAPIIAAAIESGKYLGPVPDIGAELASGASCVGCHRGMESAEKVDSSVHLPRMADCLVCHDQIDNPFSCEECHAPDFELRPASHTRDFVDEHSAGKMSAGTKLTCQPCHGVKFRCMGCH